MKCPICEKEVSKETTDNCEVCNRRLCENCFLDHDCRAGQKAEVGR